MFGDSEVLLLHKVQKNIYLGITYMRCCWCCYLSRVQPLRGNIKKGVVFFSLLFTCPNFFGRDLGISHYACLPRPKAAANYIQSMIQRQM